MCAARRCEAVEPTTMTGTSLGSASWGSSVATSGSRPPAATSTTPACAGGGAGSAGAHATSGTPSSLANAAQKSLKESLNRTTSSVTSPGGGPAPGREALEPEGADEGEAFSRHGGATRIDVDAGATS